ncbi:MAG: hypothetical protein RL103_885, partial [Pseudomonadota bacterium]
MGCKRSSESSEDERQPIPHRRPEKKHLQKNQTKKNRSASRTVFLKQAVNELTLRELLTATSRVQADLFTFNFAGVTCDKTSLAEYGL